MLALFREIYLWLYSLKPGFCSRNPHWSFMTVHYFYVIGMALLGSICLFINGGIEYIDALFMAGGAATQSGLNSIDINKMNTWQQIVLIVLAMMCNPISINTFVVFLRLYWFEKHMAHIAKEAIKQRRSLAKSFSKSKTTERDVAKEEEGVRGRSIVVMHDTTRPNGMTNKNATPADIDRHMFEKDNPSPEQQSRSSDESGESSASGVEIRKGETIDSQHRPQIKFADQVNPRDHLNGDRLPIQRSKEEHINFLQRQRNAEAGTVLRIPGPRDFDAGVVPEAVDESDLAARTLSNRTRADTFDTYETFESRHGSDIGASRENNHGGANDNSEDGVRPRRNITIEEPAHPYTEHVVESASAFARVLGILKIHRPTWLGGKSRSKPTSRSNPLHTLISVLTGEKEEAMPYFNWEATVGRNSVFVDLTEEQREELGGIEYRSLKTLFKILIAYNVGFTVFGIICLLPWILLNSTYGAIVDSDGQGRAWWGVFTPVSAFTDLGFTLTPDSMDSFQTAAWPLVLMSFLIIVGNTGFPIMLRCIIWVTSKYVPTGSPLWDELKFLLDHPRRCFTLMFPAKATWWLFWILVLLNGLDTTFFIILDLGNTVITQFPVHIRVLDGWFQAASTRTAGFAVVNLANLHPAIQISYLIMMYISVLPIAISVRRTNVYEENSLGIYNQSGDEQEGDGEATYIGQHLRMQLSFDLWFIFLGYFIIAIAEGPNLQTAAPGWSLFNVLFEIVSAYGTVGLSLGFPDINASFSAKFNVISKLVIIAMQIRGRHRGLPYDLDKAILLPDQQLERLDIDTAAQARRRNSSDTHNLEQITSRQTARSRERAGNLISNLLHPGPAMPNLHRNILHGQLHEPIVPRRSSVATQRTRQSSTASRIRSVSPNHGPSTGVHLDGIVEDRGRKTEGRRSFFQEDVNPYPYPERTR